MVQRGGQPHRKDTRDSGTESAPIEPEAVKAISGDPRRFAPEALRLSCRLGACVRAGNRGPKQIVDAASILQLVQGLAAKTYDLASGSDSLLRNLFDFTTSLG
jgi:hypothetical protein